MLLVNGEKPKEIMLPETLGKTVIIELVDSAKGHRRTANGMVKTNSTYLIPMKYNVVDPQTGVTTEIVFSGNRPIPFEGGHVKAGYDPEAFSISGDIVFNKKKDAEKIYALIHSIHCADNPKYSEEFATELKPIYRIKNLKNESKAKNANASRVSEALLIITNREKITDSKIAKLYKAGGFSDAELLIGNEEFENMRATLTDIAMKEPDKFFKIFEDGLSDTRVTIHDAITHGIINYVDGKGFTWGKTINAHNKPLICSIPRGKELKEAVEIFINFLKLKDDTGVFEELKKELDEK